MIDARSRRNVRGDRREPVINVHAPEDDESRLAASLRAVDDPDEAPTRQRRKTPSVRLRVVSAPTTPESRAAEAMVDAVELRLPGRVHDLEVRVDGDQFTLVGVASSYYVKQVAQHMAMHALNELMLGRLVNEIVVRSVR